MKSLACVTGASGGIGQALVEHLIGRFDIKLLFRTRNDASDVWSARGCQVVLGDLSDEAALGDLVRGAHYVFHCAAMTNGADHEQRATNVEGTARLARLAAAHGCRRFVHVSSVAVYTCLSDRSVFDEDAVLDERDHMAGYARTKLQAEHALASVARETGLECTVVRPTCVYGPNIKTFTVAPLALIAKGLPAIIGDGEGLMDVVHVDDVVRALVLAAESPRAAGETFNIGHEMVSLNQFYGCYGGMLNRKVRHLPMPVITGVSRLLSLVPGRGLAKLRQGIAFLGRMATSSDRFPSDKARRLLAYEPCRTLVSGMLQTELWARRQRLVANGPRRLDFYGELPFRPAALVHPTTEEELVDAVHAARAAGVPVRAVGALHSQSPVFHTDGVCIVLDRYHRVLEVEGTAVTVQAGMSLRAVHRALADVGLALPVSGTIAEQTIAGAISTATHGGSIHLGALSDYVEAVRIIRADGTTADYDTSDAVFHGLVVSLGLLGILSTVTLRCVPSFRLQSRPSVASFEEVIANFDCIQRGSRFVNMLYYPITDQIEILSIAAADADGEPSPSHAASESGAAAATRQKAGGAVARIAIALIRGVAWLALRNTAFQRWITRRFVGRHYQPHTGPSYEVLAFQDREGARRMPGVIRDVEFAVAYADAPAALQRLRQHFTETGRFPLLPVHVRCSARSRSWLSPAYDRDVCWIELWVYPASDRLAERVQSLLEPFHYRFHWGKAAPSSPEYVARQYQRWAEFLELRRRWDAGGMFANAYLDGYFGRAGASLREDIG